LLQPLLDLSRKIDQRYERRKQRAGSREDVLAIPLREHKDTSKGGIRRERKERYIREKAAKIELEKASSRENSPSTP
jgi:hypothetical protein